MTTIPTLDIILLRYINTYCFSSKNFYGKDIIYWVFFICQSYLYMLYSIASFNIINIAFFNHFIYYLNVMKNILRNEDTQHVDS